MIFGEGVVLHAIVNGPLFANCYVVSRARDAVVVDPGGGLDGVDEHVKDHRLNIRAVIATHGHHDHVAAAAEAVERYDAPFAVHSGDARVLDRASFYRFAFHGGDRFELPEADIDLAGTERLSFGAVEVTATHVPGHTPGSVCLEIAGQLLTGDTLMLSRSGVTHLPEFDGEEMGRSVRLLMDRHSPETLIHPGHGDACTLEAAASATLAELAR